MNCDGVRGHLSAFLDGELSAGELLRVEQHLRRCHGCADEVDALRQTVALLSSLGEVEVPASFRVQLHNRLVALGPPVAAVRRPAAALWLPGLRRWALPAAAAAAALAIGISSFGSIKNALPPGLFVTSVMPGDPVVTTTPPPGQTVPPSDSTPGPAPAGPNETAPIAVAPGPEPGDKGPDVPIGPTNPNPSGGVTVTTGENRPDAPATEEARYTYAVALRATVADADTTRLALLKRYPMVEQNGRLVHRFRSLEEWNREEAALLAILGDDFRLELLETNLTPSIIEARNVLIQRQDELETAQRKLSTITNPVERAEAQQEMLGHQKNVDAATESLDLLAKQVGAVFVTVELDSPAR